MKNLEKILNQYACTYEIDETTPGQLNVHPLTQGLPMAVYGSFARDGLHECELYSIQIDGFSGDIQDASEDWVYAMIMAILQGAYHYNLQKGSLRDRIVGGAVYLTVDKNLLQSYRCHDQNTVKRLLEEGRLEAVAYQIKE